MKWRRREKPSGQVEDRRGEGGGGGGLGLPIPGGGGGGRSGFPIPIPGGAKGGLGGLGIIGVLIALLLGSGILNGGGGGGGQEGEALEADDEIEQFVEAMTVDIQAFWEAQFAADGQQYDVTQLTLFEGSTVTGCGPASSSVGPFYCPADSHVFIDLGFFRELETRFEAPGDFAQAYVIAHEFGHHVQNLLGTSDQVHDAQRADAENANELSIRLELQADCYAGAWGNSVRTGDVDAGDVVLEGGDVEEGIAAATAVGDDRLQREATGRVNQETWTHGSSEQRVHWFNVGFESGDPNDCDTFSAEDLG